MDCSVCMDRSRCYFAESINKNCTLIAGGSIMLHDACVDKPTDDPFSCLDQKFWGKCNSTILTSPLGAEWQGGFVKELVRDAAVPRVAAFHVPK